MSGITSIGCFGSTGVPRLPEGLTDAFRRYCVDTGAVGLHAVGDVRAVVIADRGHYPAEEQPQAPLDALLPVLRDVRP